MSDSPQPHTPAYTVLKNKFSPSKPQMKSKHLVITITIVLSIITVLMLSIALLLMFNIIPSPFSSQTPVLQTASSSSSFQSSATSQASQQPDSREDRVKFPRFFTSSSATSVSSQANQSIQLASQTASISRPTVFSEPFSPKDATKFTSKTLSFAPCNDGIPVIGGIEYTHTSNSIGNVTVTHQDFAQTEKEKSLFITAQNFLQKKSSQMANANDPWGGDFLYVLRNSCNGQSIKKIQEINANDLRTTTPFTHLYGHIEFTGNAQFPDYGISIYGLKDSFVVRMYKTYVYSTSFTTQERESCTEGGVPNQSCLANIVLNSKKETIQSDIKTMLSELAFQ